MLDGTRQRNCDKCLYADICNYERPCSYYTPLNYEEILDERAEHRIRSQFYMDWIDYSEYFDDENTIF